MTITVSDFGVLSRSSSSPGAVSSRTFTPGISASRWDLLVVMVSADNAGTGGNDSVSGISDSKGLTWTLNQGITKKFTSPNTGVTTKVYTAEVGSSGFTGSDTITVHFSPDTTRCSALAWKCTADSGKYYSVIGGGTAQSPGAPGSTTGFSSGAEWNLGTITSGDVVFCGLGAERRTSATGTDSDTTNGSWVPSGSERYAEDDNTSTEDGSINLCAQYKITTGSGTQNWRMNHSASCDWSAVNVVIRENAASSPSAPNAPTVTPNGVGILDVNWNDVATPAGGREVTNYKYRYSTDNAIWSAEFSVGSATSFKQVTGLSNGQIYYFQIKAVNAIGESGWSGSGAGTTWSVPTAPTGGVAVVSEPGGFSLDWDDLSYTPAITAYYVWYSDDNSIWQGPVATAVSNRGMPGIATAGETWYFKVAGVNAVGIGAQSSVFQATMWNLPEQVLDLSAENNEDNTFTLDWTPPDNGGTAITDYVIEYSIKGLNSWSVFSHSALGAVDTCVVTGLSAITSYDFRIKAVNAMGNALNYSNVAFADSMSRASWGIDISGRSYS